MLFIYFYSPKKILNNKIIYINVRTKISFLFIDLILLVKREHYMIDGIDRKFDLIESNKSKWNEVVLNMTTKFSNGKLNWSDRKKIELTQFQICMWLSSKIREWELLFCQDATQRERERKIDRKWSMYGWNFSMFYQQKPAIRK